MRRRIFIQGLAASAAWPIAASARQPGAMRRIGVLVGALESDSEAQAQIRAVREGLEKLGWIEGRNVRIDYRWSGGDAQRAGVYAAELVGLKPDVIVASGQAPVAALQKETTAIPVVFVQIGDPVVGGFVNSLARPGGNMTGLTNYEPSMTSKWLELLKEIAPSLKRVGLLFNPRTHAGGNPYFLRAVEAAAPLLSIEVIETPVHDPGEIEGVIAGFTKEPNSGLIVLPDVFTGVHRKIIIAQVAQRRLPAIYPFRFYAADGALISYGSDSMDLHRRVPPYVDRILRGERPADIPVQAPTKFELVINLKTAKSLGLDVPASLLATADEVIE
jgi:putative tryptophan/tyrosine transport system substrate-binding protein